MTKDLGDILLKILQKSDLPNKRIEFIRGISYEVFKQYFCHSEKEYGESFFKKIISDSRLFEKFDDIIRFYYFWCKQPHLYNQTPPDFKLIVIFSVMESLVSEKYIHFSDWLKDQLRGGGVEIKTPADVDRFLSEYHALHGNRKKVAGFFNSYYPKEEKEKLLNSIRTFDDQNKRSIPLKDERELFEFIDGIRNLFIHEATDIQIKTLNEFEEKALGHTKFSSSTITRIREVDYIIDDGSVHIEALLEGFERALLNYFQDHLSK